MSNPVQSAAEIEPAGKRSGGRGALFGANAVGQACALLRYLILARFLGPEELGLAAILTLAWAMFNAVTESGADRFIVQNKNGEDEKLQEVVHGVVWLRGVTGFFGLLAVAYPLAAFYERPSLLYGLLLMSVVPLILGFVHADLRRVQRRGRFDLEARSVATAEIASLVAVVVFAVLLRSHWATALALIVRAVVLTLMSHVLAERKYRIGWHRGYLRELIKWGLPLMAATAMTYAGQQGDRALISVLTDLEQLGRYTVVLLLVFYPTASIAQTLMVTQLGGLSAGDEASRRAAAERCAGICTLVAAGCVAGFVVSAPVAVPLLFGAQYAAPVLLVALVGVLTTARFLSIWPTLLVMGAGRPGLVLVGNALRLGSLPAGWALGVYFGSLDAVVIGFIVGEIAGLAAFLVLAGRTIRTGVAASVWRLARFTVLSGCLIVAAWAWDDGAFALAFASAVAALFASAWVAAAERPLLEFGWNLASKRLLPRARRA